MPDAPVTSSTRRWPPVSGGLTLVELLVVLAIIVTLAALSLGVTDGARNYVASTRARGDLQALSQSLEMYRRQFGDYPQAADTPEKLYLALTGRLGPGGGAAHGQNFLGQLPIGRKYPGQDDVAGNCFVDPWGNAYQYIYYTRQDAAVPIVRGHVLYSFGVRDAAESLPMRFEVVPATSGSEGGSIVSSPANAKNIYAER